jgi:hypothetical protein
MAKTETSQGLTLTEIARKRGTSRDAVVRMRDRRNVQPVGGKGRAALYNLADFGEKKPDAGEQERADYRRRIDKAKAEKLELENDTKRGKLIERTLIAQVFGEIYSIDRSVLLQIGPNLTDTIVAICDTGETDRTLKIQKLIDDEIYNTLAAIKAAINKLFRRIEIDEIKDGLPEPKIKQKAKAAAIQKPAEKKRDKSIEALGATIGRRDI